VRTRAAAVGLVIAVSGCGPAPIERSSTPRQISASGKGAYEAALVPRDGGVITAWYDTRDGNAEIYMRLLDATGNPAGPERRLTNGPEESYEPSIDRIGEDVVIAWYDKSRDGMLIPKLGQWNRNGANSWVRALAPRGRNPVVSVYAGEIFCAWIAPAPDGREFVWGGWWGSDGTSRGSLMLAPAGKTTWNLNAVARGRRQAWVVYDATAGTRADELFLVDISDEGATVTRLTADDGVASKYPDIAAGERVALTWYDERDGNKEVYLLAVASDALTPDAAERGTRVTSTPGDSIGAYVAWKADRIGLAWSDDVDGQMEIHFQPFDSAGRPRAAAQRLTRNSTSSLIPAIEPWGSGFALAWNEYVPAAEGHAGTSEIAFVVVR
jgi:hypothetical protein